MKLMRSMVMITLFVLVAGTNVLAASSETTKKAGADLNLVHPGYLTVSDYGSYPPWITISPDGKLGGLDGIYLNRVAAANGLKIKLFQTTFASLILAVEEHKVDVGTYLSYTPERAKHVYYTAPFQVAVQSVFTKHNFPYNGPASLMGKKVGTVVGYLQQSYLQKWCKSCVSLFPNEVEADSALLNGQIDALFTASTSTLSKPLSDHLSDIASHSIRPGQFDIPGSYLNSLSYNIVSCSDSALGEAMNKEMKSLHSSGAWKTIFKGLKLSSTFDAGTTVPKEFCS